MEISSVSNTVTITGNIKSINDFQEIKSTFDALKSSNRSITVQIKESISITSSVIGYFNKLILKDGVLLTFRIGNKQLLNLLDDLNLTRTFNATKG